MPTAEFRAANVCRSRLWHWASRPLVVATTLLLSVLLPTVAAGEGGRSRGPRALFTTDSTGAAVNQNRYQDKRDVYINGAPRGGLSDGDWVFQVTDPAGFRLLSTDPARCRLVRVEGGEIVALRDLSWEIEDHQGDDECHTADDPDAAGGSSGRHDTNPAPRAGQPRIVVQLMPFHDTPNRAGVYKVWLTPLERYLANGGNLHAEPRPCRRRSGQSWGSDDHRWRRTGSCLRPDPGFRARFAKTDNFKVRRTMDNLPPIADAGEDQSVAVGGVAMLDGSGSSDPDGDPLTFEWVVLEQPPGSTSQISDPGVARPQLTIDVAGSYLIKLVVDDGTATSTDEVLIDTFNSAPIADAGPDQSVPIGATVVLDGSGSGDPDGDSLLFSWSLLEQPPGSSAVLDDPSAVRPTFVADQPGSYRVVLTVDDGVSTSDADEVVVTTENSIPVADAGGDQTVPLGALVILDGAGSSDVDGDPLTYLWSLVSVPDGSVASLSDLAAVSPTFIADQPGDYVAQLVVSDSVSDSEPDQIVVSTENSTPIANAGPDQTVDVGATVTLDGTSSMDADGDALTFSWSLVSVPAGSLATLDDTTAPRPTFVADVSGDYVVQLITSDGEASSSPDTVTVSAGNSRPVAEAGPDQSYVVAAGQRTIVQLDGSNSFDVDGDALSFSWSITSAPPPPSPFISPAFLDDPASVTPVLSGPPVVGDYVVQLIVSDGELDSNPDTVSIEHENVAPFADAGDDQVAFAGDTVQLDGSGSFDANGDALTFSWSFASRPAGSLATLDDPTSVMPSFVMDLDGTYVVHLVVDDGELDSDSSSDTSVRSNVTITTANAPPTASAGPDQSVLVGDLVFLDGSGSSDPDGDALTFSWALLSTPAGSTATLDDPTLESPAFEVDAAGTYMAQLIVSDGELTSAPDSVLISTVGSRPVADAGSDQTVFAGRLVVLDGTASLDADGDPITFSWAITSRPPGSSAALDDSGAEQPTFFADLPGTYLVQLIVNDGGADSQPDSVVVVALPSNTLRIVLDDPLVGIDRAIGGTLLLGSPAPVGGLLVTLSSDDPAVAAVDPGALVVPEGVSAAAITVDGLSVGETLLRASAPDYNPAATAIGVTDFLISLDEDLDVAPGESVSLPVSLSQPAPPGGLTLFLETEDEAIATITPAVFVPAGQQLPTANPQVSGVAIGQTVVTATAERFAPDQAAITVTLELRFARESTPLGLDTREVQLLLSAPAPAGGLTIDLATDDPAIATVPATVTALAGTTSVLIPVTGVGNGLTLLRASALDVDEATTEISVNARITVNLGQPIVVGRDLQESFGVSLGAPAPVGGATVTVTSEDPSRLLLSTAPTISGAGQVVVQIPMGENSAPVWAQALEMGGSVGVTASALDWESGTGSVELNPSGFAWTTAATVQATTLDADVPLPVVAFVLGATTLRPIEGQALRAGLSVAVTVTSSDPLVGAVVGSPVVFEGGEASREVFLDPISAGSTTLAIATPPGFSTPDTTGTVLGTERQATITSPAIGCGVAPVGANLQRRISPGLLVDPPSPVDVTMTIADPSVAVVSRQQDQTGSGELVFDDVTTRSLGQVYLQGISAGTTTLTLEAPGYSSCAETVEVVPSGLRFTSGAAIPTSTFASNLSVDLETFALIGFNPQRQEVRGGFSTEAVVTSSDPSVAAVLGPATVQLVFPPSSRIAVEVDPLAEGTSTLAIVQPPGFVDPGFPTQRPITVTQPFVRVTSTSSSSIDDFRVGRELQGQLTYRLSVAPPAPVDVVVTVDSPLATLSTDTTIAGSSSLTLPQGRRNHRRPAVGAGRESRSDHHYRDRGRLRPARARARDLAVGLPDHLTVW